ncbi:hypothetical protein [Microbacterium lacus]
MTGDDSNDPIDGSAVRGILFALLFVAIAVVAVAVGVWFYSGLL